MEARPTASEDDTQHQHGEASLHLLWTFLLPICLVNARNQVMHCCFMIGVHTTVACLETGSLMPFDLGIHKFLETCDAGKDSSSRKMESRFGIPAK